MKNRTNRRVLLRNRPSGLPKESDFVIEETFLSALGEGEVLRQTVYLSLDPYMRGRMSDGPSYASSAALGQAMVGGTISRVIESRNSEFSEGDFVLGYDGWQEFGISDGRVLQKLDPSRAKLSYWLGILGMPGMTAYVALLDIGHPRPGETVVVSAAAGAVGSVVGQIAKIKGCRAVGIAGSDEKCRIVREEFGFDAAINYKTEDLPTALKAACPDGIDVYYDNVAGKTLEAVMGHLNLNARIPLVGLISQYNASSPPPGPNLMPLLVKRALIQGFLVSDHVERRDAFVSDVSGWLGEGKLRYREDIVQGLENASHAFIGLFEGRNLGKLLIQVSDE